MLSDSMIESVGPCQVALLQHWRDTNWKHQHENLVKLHEQKTTPASTSGSAIPR